MRASGTAQMPQLFCESSVVVVDRRKFTTMICVCLRRAWLCLKCCKTLEDLCTMMPERMQKPPLTATIWISSSLNLRKIPGRCSGVEGSMLGRVRGQHAWQLLVCTSLSSYFFAHEQRDDGDYGMHTVVAADSAAVSQDVFRQHSIQSRIQSQQWWLHMPTQHAVRAGRQKHSSIFPRSTKGL